MREFTVIVRLTVRAVTRADAIHAVDRVLDDGDFQDAINEHGGNRVRVVDVESE